MTINFYTRRLQFMSKKIMKSQSIYFLNKILIVIKSLIVGLSTLLIFWLIIVMFIFLRKPEKSKLTMKLFLKSLMLFILIYLIIIVFV